MRPILAFLALWAFCAAPTASAEPVVKILNFTAKWCANCRILDPKLTETLAALPGSDVQKVDLDLTYAGRQSSPEERDHAFTVAARKAERHKVRALWDRHQGLTGLAVIVASDTGETISCLDRSFSQAQIRERIERARILTLRRAPGDRAASKRDCPANFSG